MYVKPSIRIGLFANSTKDMQTFLRSGHLYVKDAQSAEKKEKLYPRFFRFLSYLRSNGPKRCAKQ